MHHAHFDCFSGAAGDMLLAACIDAADSLPHPLQLGPSPAADVADVDGDGGKRANGGEGKNSDRMLARIVRDLEGGMPELRGEFELSATRVWRGMGRIAAMKVDVESAYHHEAAPVPGAEAHRPERGHSHDMHVHQQHSHDHHEHASNSSGAGGEGKEDPQHEHSHGHSHDHSNSDADLRIHDHSHGHSHSHSHGHDHQSGGKLRNLPQIARMLHSAAPAFIPSRVAALAIEAFTELAHAERATHGAPSIDQVHFHEVGAVDSIVDTVGTLLALHHLGVDLGDENGSENGRKCTITCSPLPLGEGTVWTDHGLLPVPAPATLRLMVGMPTCPGPKGVTGELVTPTAAALLRVLTDASPNSSKEDRYWHPLEVPGRPPCFVPRAVGVGGGTKDFEKHPNILRLILGDVNPNSGQRGAGGVVQPELEAVGETGSRSESNDSESNRETQKVSGCAPNNDANVGEADVEVNTGLKQHEDAVPQQRWNMHTLTHMQANIDDATPEVLAHAVDLLLNNGAVDAWIQPIVMKKGRPAHSLHCLCRCESDDEDGDKSSEHRLLNVLFRHTTTLGIRIQRNILRAALERRFVEVQLPYRDNARDGKVNVKISSFTDGEVVSVKAEFDQCKAVSEESAIPLKIISSTAERLAWDHNV